MSDILITRMRKARQIKVEVDGHTFICRRPTDAEASELFQAGLHGNRLHVAREFVDGWEKVIDADVVVSGGDQPATFTRDLWREWCDDRPDFWEPIYTKVMESYEKHCEDRKAAAKN